MQNHKEFLYDLISTKAFENLSPDERINVLAHLTEEDYRDYAVITNNLGKNINIAEINPDGSFKKSLVKKVDSLKPKTSVIVYKMAACFAVFLIIGLFYTRKITTPTKKIILHQIAKNQKVIELKPILKKSNTSAASAKRVRPLKEEKSIAKTASLRHTQISNKKRKLEESENKKTDTVKEQLALDIDITPFSKPGLNSENTQANDVYFAAS